MRFLRAQVDEATVVKDVKQYTYSEGEDYVFMDMVRCLHGYGACQLLPPPGPSSLCLCNLFATLRKVGRLKGSSSPLHHT